PRPCSQNRGATGIELPTPARHGQNERVMTLNRKNALFAGSDDGGDHWAVIASMIETCKLNGVDPQAWLTDTLKRLAAGHSNLRRNQLMPWNHTPAVA
ncbi:MAG: transposase domain-containing protein, partial [Stellaceae bacterium]